MNEATEITCEDVVVEFPFFDSVSRSVKARMGGDKGARRTFRALDGISVSIKKGDRVGLLGRNGAGKSTFLRTLAGVYQPKSGYLQVNGTTTGIFDVRVGADVNATGYENIPLLMATRSLPSSMLEAVTKDVEEFTELGDALNRPLRTYSSGMRLRIAFAIATFRIEGTLLMDEIIGVGDRHFAESSKARVAKFMGQAGTLVLASHSEKLLRENCNKGLVFDAGRVVFSGPIEDAIKYS